MDNKVEREVKRYESWEQAVRDAENNPNAASFISAGSGDRPLNAEVASWRKGPDSKLVRSIESLFNKIDASFDGREKETWTPSVHGAYPIVPEYLAGHPECMRARRPVESDQAPVTFWIELGLSESVSDGDAVSRAAAIGALIAKTGETRPVDAKIICVSNLDYTQDVFVQIDLDLHLMDATNIARSLVMREAVRPLRWATIVSQAQFTPCLISWAFGIRTDAAREAKIRRKFRAAPQDVVIQALITSTGEFRDPVKWVHTQLEKQRDVA